MMLGQGILAAPEAVLNEGKFFRLPQGPDDVRRLWANAAMLDPSRLPDWLASDDGDCYRLIASPASTAIADHERHQYDRELDVFRELGFVVEKRPDDATAYDVYMPRPRDEAIWSIGLYAGPSPLELQPLHDIRNPILRRGDVTDVPASFVADPFLLRTGGVWHLFFEVWNWRTYKGEIGLAVSADLRNWEYRQIVLAEPYHLSYPHVFEWRGEYFMVPESHHAGSVRLYKADPFPTHWTCIGSMLSGPYLADASLFRHHERWWMFIDASANEGHDTLRLLSSPELLGPWCEHPASPIVAADPHKARPAGRVFTAGKHPIRFAQNCSRDYGTDVRAFAIVELTADRYVEQAMSDKPILGPGDVGWNAGGMHHLDLQSHKGGLIAAVDGWHFACDPAPDGR